MMGKASFFLEPNKIFDSFYACSVEIWGQEFPTAEHAYQWKKFSDFPEIARQIVSAKNPIAVKKISVLYKHKVPANWDEQKATNMEEILRAKMQQHVEVRDILKAADGSEIVENSKEDGFWGMGDGDGKNMMGIFG